MKPPFVKATTIFRYTLLFIFLIVRQAVQAQNQPLSKYQIEGMATDSIDQQSMMI